MVLVETEATAVAPKPTQETTTKLTDGKTETELRIIEYDDFLIVHPSNSTTENLVQTACSVTKRAFKYGRMHILPADWIALLESRAANEDQNIQKEISEICKAISITSELTIQMCVTYIISSHDGGFKIRFYVSYTEEGEPAITQKLHPEDASFREISGINPEEHPNCECSITRDLTPLEVGCATQYFAKVCAATIIKLAS